MRYTYETDEGSKNSLVTNSGWKVDGVEGFVLPGPQPGTVKLCRKFNGSDYILFPGSGTNGDDCSADSECHLTLASSCGPGGYSQPPAGASLGYVFPLARFSNISVRAWVGTDNDVAIAGFIIAGTAPKKVVIRGRGPSLVPFGITNALVNPFLHLVSGQTVIGSNDDWGSSPNWQEIQASGVAPGNAVESAIMMTLNSGAYTAIASGVGGGTGVAILELFVP